MRAARVWTAALLLCVLSAHCEALARCPSLRISRSSASRGGSKSYFDTETASPLPSPPPRGFVWPIEAPSASSDCSESNDGVANERVEIAGSKAKVKPYKAHFKVKYKPRKCDDRHNDDDDDDDDDSDDDSDDDWYSGWLPRTSVALSVDAGVRAFVRAMDADAMDGERHLVARIVVLGDSRELVDAVVDVAAVELPVNSTAAAAFRLQTRTQSPRLLSGRLLVQVLWNTQAFQLQGVNASGDSVVVVEPSALASSNSWMFKSQALELVASNSSRLLVNMAGMGAVGLALTAQHDAALVVQSSSGLTISRLELRQRGRAKLALVAQWLSSAVVSASMESASQGDSGVLCVQSVDQSTLSTLDANVSASGALLQWATSSRFASTCHVATVNASGDATRVDLGSLQAQYASVATRGSGSLTVVNSYNLFTASLGVSAKVTNVARTPSRETGATDTRCSLASLTAAFPLPPERAASVVLASGQSWQAVSASPVERSPKPDTKPVPSEQPPPPDSQRDAEREEQEEAKREAQEAERESREKAEGDAREEAERQAEQRQPQTNAPPHSEANPQPTSSRADGSGGAADGARESFVNGSLHMLGSIPYVDAIVVFLVSAWILHHLLQCYDRRQRRRRYTPLGDAADRVWI